MAALWLFFVALKYGEPSRVVPLVGSSVPVATLILAVLFLNEQLAAQQLLAIALLIGGGIVLSIKLGGGAPLWKLGSFTAVASGAAFAGHFAVTKYIYTLPAPFVALFAYVRIGVGVWALLLLLLLWHRQPAKRARRTKAQWAIGGIAAAFVISKVVGMAALLLQNYAIAIGSVSVVNALQGAQYFFVLVLALIFSHWAPKFFREEVSRVALAQKIIGIACITVGLGLLVW
jgi:drug/metabolite transporter (DMT)-like permease